MHPLGPFDPSPPESGRLAGVSVPEGYRSAGDLAVALRLLLWAWVVLGGIAVASDLAELSLVGELIGRPAFVTDQAVTATDQRQTAIAAVQLLGTLLIGGVFLLWTRRAYRNLWPLGTAGMRYRPGWAIGAWVVPFLNLFRPRQIIDDVWRAGDPDLAPGSAAWRGAAVPALFHVWWALWIVGGVVGTWFGFQPTPETLDDYRALTGVTVVLDALHAAAALFAAWTVETVTRRQEHVALRRVRAPRRLRRSPVPDAARYAFVATLGLAAFTAARLALG